MSRNAFVSGTLCKKDDTWFLNTGERSIQIRFPLVIDPALENQKVSITGKWEGATSPPGIDETFNALRIVSQAAIAKRALAISKSEKSGSAADNWYLAERELLERVEKGIFTVEGAVTGPGNVGLMVKAFDRNVGEVDTLLGQTRTDAQGNYSITCTAEKLNGKSAADLVIALYRGDTQLQSSDVIFDAPQETLKDFILPEAIAPEFQRLTDKIKLLLKNKIDLGKLERNQVDFLNKKTGIDTRKIQWLTQSQRLAGKNETLAIFYYAILSQDLPTDPAAILSYNRAIINRAVQCAITSNLIPELKAEEVNRILDKDLPKFKGKSLLKHAGKGQPASLGDILDTMPLVEKLSGSDRLAFATLYGLHGNTEKLWKLAKAGSYAAKVPSLQRTLSLNEITQGHKVLNGVLQGIHNPSEPGSTAYLAKLSLRDWLELSLTHGAPPDRTLTAVEYGFDLERTVEQRFPSAVLRERLAAKEITIKAFPSEEVVNVLSKHPDFDIRKERASTFLERIGINNPEVSSALKKIQRVLPLAGGLQASAVLLNAGYDSACMIAHTSSAVLAARVGDKLTKEAVNAIHTAAKNVMGSSMALAARLSPRFNPHEIPAIPRSLASMDFLNKNPNLRTLFGDLDYCACRHCQSVLGPAAYLADLLHFLETSGLPSPGPGGVLKTTTAFMGLFTRRPDLANLLLTCENTNIEIPYIDLVLEVLENTIALPIIREVSTSESAKILAALNQNQVPTAIRETLQDTAITIGDTLTATPITADALFLWEVTATLSSRHGFNPTAIPVNSDLPVFRIDDGSRRWVVGYLPRILWMATPESPGKFIPSEDIRIDVDAAEDALKNSQLPPFIKDELQEFKLPFTHAITYVEGAEKVAYEVACTLGVDLLILSGKGQATLRFWGFDGLLLREEHVAKNSTVLILRWLRNESLTRKELMAVLSLLKLPSLPWSKLQDRKARRWLLRFDLPKIILAISEPILAVFSLTYRSSSIQTDFAAVPENRNPAAYEVLRKAIFPWTLPLDLWTEEVRVYLQELGLPRQKLMEIAGLDLASDFEVLGLCRADTWPGLAKPWDAWGLKEHGNTIKDSLGEEQSGDWRTILQSVAVILQQSGLSYRELLDIRQTGEDAIKWTEVSPLGECHPAKMRWEAIDVDQLAWIHAFTRLSRKINWSMRDLDRVLAALGVKSAKDIWEIHPLSQIARLRSKLNQPILILAAMLGHIELKSWIDHTKEGEPASPSLYDSVFQRNALRPSSSFADFSISLLSRELAYLEYPAGSKPPEVQSLTQHAHFLAAALGITHCEVEQLVKPENRVDIEDKLNLSNVVKLFGVVFFCRSLQLCVEDFLGWTTLFGNPFSAENFSVRAHALVAFADQFEFVKQSGTSFDELAYLLRHDLQGQFVNAGARMRIVLADIRGVLQKGALLGNASLENLAAQIKQLGTSEILLAAISGGESGLSTILKAEVEIDSLMSPLPELPAELGGRFYYRMDSSGRTPSRLGCLGAVEDDDFAKLLPLLKCAANLKKRYKLIRGILSSQLLFLNKQDVDLAIPIAPLLTATTKVEVSLSLPEDMRSFLCIEPVDGTRWLKLAGFINEDQCEALKQALPELEKQLDELKSQSEELEKTGVPFLDRNMADDLLCRKSDTVIRNVMLKLVPIMEVDLLASQLSSLTGLETPIMRGLIDRVTLEVGAGVERTALTLLTDSDLLASATLKTIEEGQFDDQVRVLLRLDKASRLLRGVGFTAAQLEWIEAGMFATLRLNDLPVAYGEEASLNNWRAVRDLVRFRDTVAGGTETVQALADLLKSTNSTVEKAQSVFAEAYALAQSEVDAACQLLKMTTPQWQKDFRNPKRLLQLVEFLHVVKLLGTTVDIIIGFFQEAPCGSDAMAARKLFMAQFDAETLPKRLQPISDRLRVRQRDALVSYLKWRDQLPEENALLDYYLIDVKMEPCMRTSRIKQAISSVQLFIQRCLLNLESKALIKVLPSHINTAHWSWMKNYRVWEANRKVFLYPENWIEPDLRDNKSEIFQAFESDLMQENLDFEVSLDTFRGYLERAADIARLRVVAMWRELPSGNLVNQILARDSAAQARFFHRELTITDDTLSWTPWEGIEGSIDSEHIFTFKLAGFLHIAYAEITADAPHWKVGLAVRRKNKKGWSALYKSNEQDALRLPMIPNKHQANTFIFRLNTRPEQDGEYLDISGHTIDYEGTYVLAPNEGELTVTQPYSTGIAQRLQASIRVLEKFSDQYGHTAYAKPSARDWSPKIVVLIQTSPDMATMLPYMPYIKTSLTLNDEVIFSDSHDFLQYFDFSNELACTIKVSKIIIWAFGDAGIHEEYALSLVIDAENMGSGSYERDIVFTIKKELNHPAFAPDRPVTFCSIGKKFVVNEYLSISTLTDVSSSSGALPALPNKNSEHFRSGFRQLWPIEEAQAEAAAADALAAVAEATVAEAEVLAVTAAVEAREAATTANAAKAQQKKAEAEAEKLKQDAENAWKVVTGLALVLGGAGVAEATTTATALSTASTIAKAEAKAAAEAADKAEKAAKQAAAKASIPAEKADKAAGRAKWLRAEADTKKEHAAQAALYQSVGEYLTHSNGRYFIPCTQPKPQTWSVSDAYYDNRFQLYFLWHADKQRILAEGQAWLYAGLRQLPAPVEPGASLPLLPASFQVLGDGQGTPAPGDPLAIPLGPLGKDSLKDLRVSFATEQPNSLYDWEAVFHAPLLIATQLSAAQRFEDAQRWFHTIFDPTTNDSEKNEAKRYWRFPPFREAGHGENIEQVFEQLARNTPETLEDVHKIEDLQANIAAWKDNPFNPHLIARSRIRAYQWAVVIKYIENLIAWGDQLFRSDTIESINEATQLYVLAARILGPRPASIPRCELRSRSYLELAHMGGGLDVFANAWVALEDMGGMNFQDTDYDNGLNILPQGLYFCIPPNSDIEDLWNTVEERLFNIRHCMNIEGVERRLPLFEPPIDPALLVKAAAAGLDINTVLADLASPLPRYRFNVMLSKAIEICAELKSLGAALLNALEKNDAEALSLLRSSHEIQLLRLTEQVRKQQVEEAKLNMEGLHESRKTIEERYRHYQQLLGQSEISVPLLGEPAILLAMPLNLAQVGSDGTGLGISKTELDQLNNLGIARDLTLASGVLNVAAGVTFAFGSFFMAAPVASALGQGINATASAVNTASNYISSLAGRDALVGGYERRRDDWIFQSNMALRELQQIDKQIAAAEIRIAIADRELDNLRRQAENSIEVDAFMRSKFTNRELYRWMSSQLSLIYFRTYHLAYDMAKRAEKTFQYELGVDDTSFIQYGYWDSLRKGLLSGENITLDLKRLEVAYLEQNRRDFEISKHVSLLQLDPFALITLRETGQCNISIPEALFDIDFPGHYFRRIKSVSLTIPCVAGPYTSVNCTLRLLKHSYRKTTQVVGPDGYPRTTDPQGIPDDDNRFADSVGMIQSIATSHGQNDSGMFELNFRDERYLPFEGVGAISAWRIELPTECKQFDYNTISDVVLHLKYTAREGGGQLRNAASSHILNSLKQAANAGMVRVFSVRHEFPTEWARFTAPFSKNKKTAHLLLELRQEHFPFWAKGRITRIDDITALVKGTNMTIYKDAEGEIVETIFGQDPSIGNILKAYLNFQYPISVTDQNNWPIVIDRYFDTNHADDLWLAVTWNSNAFS